MDTPIIDFENVDLCYDLTKVLHNVSLIIKRGEHCAILGANGSGKSTLIKLINCELYPSYKDEPFRREILGCDRWEVAELRKKIGVVTNDLHTRFGLDGGHLSGLETVLSGFYGTLGCFSHQYYSPDQRDRARETMQKLGISHLAAKRLGEMSTGELRKCIVARSMVHPIEAILLDEPTVGLDIKAQIDFIEMMRSLARMQTTVILVTHHIEEIFEEIAKVVLIHQGGIFAEGTKEETITGENLSGIFGMALEVTEHKGRYTIAPAY